jgi:hypothetical protein
MFNNNHYHLDFPINQEEQAAHKLGLQSWFRQFQPSFSSDPMVVPEFQKGFHRLGANLPWDYGRRQQNVRGPLARFTPGNPSFEASWFGDGTPKPPPAAFYYDNVFGTINPFRYGNVWESNQAYNNRMFPPSRRT